MTAADSTHRLVDCAALERRAGARRRRHGRAICSRRRARRTCSSSSRATVRFPTATRRKFSASAATIARRAWRVRWCTKTCRSTRRTSARIATRTATRTSRRSSTPIGAIAERAKATVTPQAVVVGPGGIVKYRGRIDNQYAALGKPRRVVTVHDLRDALDAVLAGRRRRSSRDRSVRLFYRSA